MITMSKSDYEIILKHARENLPEEACGLVAGKKEGKDKFIEKVYCLTNIDHSNEHFSLDPKEQLAAVKDMRANGLVPLGNWGCAGEMLRTCSRMAVLRDSDTIPSINSPASP